MARELKRHVAGSSSKSSRGTKAAVNNTKQQQQEGASRVLWACVGFVGFVATVPYFCVQWIGGLTDKDDPLSSSQIRRGAFNNSGSRDAGRDPNWDLSRGVYKPSKELRDLLAKEDPKHIDIGDEERYFRKR